MAVELVDRRALHEHAVPVVFLLLTLIILSAACYGFYANTQVNASKLGRGLTTSLIKVERGSNGLAHVSLSTAIPDQPHVNAAASAGQSANLSFSFK